MDAFNENCFNIPKQYSNNMFDYISDVLNMIEKYRFILETHPIDYLIQQPLNKLPKSWLKQLHSDKKPEPLHLLGMKRQLMW